MKNILSYQPGTKFNGKEIKDWIEFHISHATSHTRQAEYLKAYYSNISDNRIYFIYSNGKSPYGKHRHIYAHSHPQITRAN